MVSGNDALGFAGRFVRFVLADTTASDAVLRLKFALKNTRLSSRRCAEGGKRGVVSVRVSQQKTQQHQQQQ